MMRFSQRICVEFILIITLICSIYLAFYLAMTAIAFFQENIDTILLMLPTE